mmetsp:Transcript_9736/g.12797  ORF Transcript_9736/g.12797 Transcript_9736/m.12797 type:complete len:87 (+) Transcript_9736:150-410(+)
MVNKDNRIGIALFSFLVLTFVYYTLWVIILPFVETKHPIQAYFPPRKYAISVPLALMTLIFVTVFTFIGVMILRDVSTRKFNKSSS